jgi:pantoate--beta-alanine ligase
MVQPEVAIFGEKDFQQLLVIRRLVEELDLPIEVNGAPTQREPDGLAMSSRNGYLNAEERAIAPRLRAALLAAGRRLAAGAGCAAVERETEAALAAAGFTPDYVSVRRRLDLLPPDREPRGAQDRALIILAAARLGRARLIDNLACDLPS